MERKEKMTDVDKIIQLIEENPSDWKWDGKEIKYAGPINMSRVEIWFWGGLLMMEVIYPDLSLSLGERYRLWRTIRKYLAIWNKERNRRASHHLNRILSTAWQKEQNNIYDGCQRHHSGHYKDSKSVI